jgi:hypothetical protein
MTVKSMHFPPMDVADVREGFAHLEREHEFWQEHFEEYRELYPDEFVAVSPDGNVVAHSPDLGEFARRVRARGYTRRQFFSRFMLDPSVRFIL